MSRPVPPRAALSRSRRWLFRLVAVVLGLAPLLLCETALRLVDVGRPRPADDPFVAFSTREPLFALDTATGLYKTAPAHRLCFRDQQFLAHKPAGTVRIFCFGGSTVQGHPYNVETSFTTWLQIALQALDPARSWEVINCGGISYASYRLAPMVEESLGYEPDLVILYTGHNEFLEDRSYGAAGRLPGVLRGLVERAARLRTFQVVKQGYHSLVGASQPRLGQNRTILPAEVDALLDYKGGLERYQRDPAWTAGVIRHFQHNMTRMLDACQAAGVPVVLVNPVANLATPPFKSLPREDLSDSSSKECQALLSQALRNLRKSPATAVELLTRAVALDPENATLAFELGQARLAMGDLAGARQALQRSCDLDLCPLRVTSPLQRVVLNLARQRQLSLLDAKRLIDSRSKSGLPDQEWLVDHVHPSIRGHQLIARALLENLREAGFLPNAGAIERAQLEPLFQARLDSLPPLYFLQAEVRLKNLEDWARGRAERDPSRGPIAREVRERRPAGSPLQ